MSTWVTPKKVEHATNVIRYHFVRGPLFRQLGPLFANREPVYIRVVKMVHEGFEVPACMDLSILPNREGFARYKKCILMAGCVIATNQVETSGFSFNSWSANNQDIEAVFNLDPVERSGFFVLAGGLYTLFKND